MKKASESFKNMHPLNLKEERVGEQWWSFYRRNIDGCYDGTYDLNKWQHANKPAKWWKDNANKITLYFNGWNFLGGPEFGLYIPVFVGQVNWEGRVFRFYSNIFKTPQIAKFSDPKKAHWMTFKIELVEGLEPGDLEIVKKLIEKIVKNIKHKTTLKNIEEGYVHFVSGRFEEYPQELLGE